MEAFGLYVHRQSVLLSIKALLILRDLSSTFVTFVFSSFSGFPVKKRIASLNPANISCIP